MANYKTTLEASRELKLSIQRINAISLILGFNRFSKRKRILNDLEVEQIRNFNNNNDLRNKHKYSPKKINVIDFYLTHRNNSCVEIANKMEVSIHFVSTTVNEWLENNSIITVASKI